VPAPTQQQDTTRLVPGPVRRLREHLREIRRLAGETYALLSYAHAENLSQLGAIRTLLAQLQDVVTSQGEASAQLGSRLDELAVQQAESSAGRPEEGRLVEILRFVHDRAHWRRERLQELRADPEYQRAYSDPDPLVSVVIPTYDNHRLIRERSIPSILAQSYQNFEVVVVGDAAPDEARRAVEAFDDPRITFYNRPYRGPYPDNPQTRWLVSGVPAYNEAVRCAQGRWIAPLDDDDAFRPHHLEALLERARSDRLELTYGRMSVHFADGSETTIGRFPPEMGQFGVQAALYHAQLRNIFECELADAAFGLPSDWALCLRMMEAGVRIGMRDDVTVDYYPSRSWTPRWEGDRYGPEEKEANAAECGSGAAGRDQRPEWEYVPEGWERTRNLGERSAGGWDVEEVARAYRKKWPQFLAAVAGSGPLGVNHEMPEGTPVGRHDLHDQNAILAFAYAVGRAANGTAVRAGSRATLSVLDWGGALGHHRVLAGRLLPEIDLEYHCRELPAVCAAGRAVHPEVTFHDTDDCFSRGYDLILASSSLQYQQDWQRLLRQFANAADGWLFLTRVPVVTHHPSFVVLQRVDAYGYATETLGWAFNRDELLGAAGELGLELEREFLVHPPWEITGAPDEVSHAGFLLRVPDHG
jgi:putative methyltransferase (TIGR04325 family)